MTYIWLLPQDDTVNAFDFLEPETLKSFSSLSLGPGLDLVKVGIIKSLILGVRVRVSMSSMTVIVIMTMAMSMLVVMTFMVRVVRADFFNGS